MLRPRPSFTAMWCACCLGAGSDSGRGSSSGGALWKCEKAMRGLHAAGMTEGELVDGSLI